LLTAHGVRVHHDPAQLAQRLGLRVSEDHGVLIKQVLNGSAAHAAGFAPGDEWLGVEVTSSKASNRTQATSNTQATQAWRLKKLDDVLLYAGSAKKVVALVSRDRQLLKLNLSMPSAKEHSTWRLAIDDTKKVTAWLKP
jgi:predicted metalloprotease with PDZ domain